LVAVLALAGAGCTVGEARDEAAVVPTVGAIHNEFVCGVTNLGPAGAALAAASRYGNWCGGDIWGQGGPPVNCWDEACRHHDYSFHGPDPDANDMMACHEVLNVSVGNAAFVPGRVPDTACIDAADDVLCGEWTQCSVLAAAARIPANGGWRFVSVADARGQGRGRTIRRCDDPRAGDHGFPTRCPWYEHPVAAYLPRLEVPEDQQVWTCGTCPGSSPTPPPALPNPACAVRRSADPADRIRQCCADYASDERARSCDCPADKPMRRDGEPDLSGVSYSVTCVACPSDRPVWNGTTGPCLEAFPSGGAPSNAVACCFARADVEVGGLAVPATIHVGDHATFQLRLLNHGPNDAQGVVATIDFPPELTPPSALFSISTTGGVSTPCSTSGNVVTCAIGDLPRFDPAASSPIVVVIEGGAPATAPGQLSVTVNVSTISQDPDLANNETSVGWTVAQMNALRAYVTTGGAASVAVIDVATMALVKTIPVGSLPVGVTLIPDGTRAYVTNALSNTVSVIDTKSNAVTATIGVSTLPFDIAAAPDGQRVWVVNGNAGSISAIDTATNAVVQTIALGSCARGIALTPDGARAYVANTCASTVAVIDLGSSAVSSISVKSVPTNVAISPDGSLVYVSHQSSRASLTVIDTASNSVVSSQIFGNGGSGWVSVAPDGAVFLPIQNGIMEIGGFNAFYPLAGRALITPDDMRVFVVGVALFDNVPLAAVRVHDRSTTLLAAIPLPSAPNTQGPLGGIAMGMVPLPTP
jgi:YVTN family beta-propeller protein